MEACAALLQDAQAHGVQFAAGLGVVGEQCVGVLLDMRIAHIDQAQLWRAHIPPSLACDRSRSIGTSSTAET